MSKPRELKLDQLEDAYELLAELDAREGSRVLSAKRREDGHDVLIVVARKVDQTEQSRRSALDLFAADVKLLGTLEHRALVPIFDGRWIEPDGFAVVSEEIRWPSLAELLARGEEFSCPRIASVLREINGLLEWARGQSVVHRWLSTDTIFLEPGTDRVLASFLVRALPLEGGLDARVDARTIAELARSMLAPNIPEKEAAGASLGQLRPALPQRLVEQTDTLLGPTLPSGEPPDMTSYIALVAMADSVHAGEEEADRLRTAFDAERQAATEQLAAERAELDRLAADQTRSLGEERERLAEERFALEQFRADSAKTRADIERRLQELERRSEELAQMGEARPLPPPAAPAGKGGWRRGRVALIWSRLRRKKWALPSMAAAVLLIVALGGAHVVQQHRLLRERERQRVHVAGGEVESAFHNAPASASATAGPLPAAQFGAAMPTPWPPVSAWPPAAIDSAALAAALRKADSVPEPKPRRRRRPAPVVDTLAAPVDSSGAVPLPPVDSALHRIPPGPVTPSDTVQRVRPISDTVSHRDSAITRRDTSRLRPDSALVKRDSTPRPRPDSLP
jgi:hypothetical protein